jgi:hypothetical protein
MIEPAAAFAHAVTTSEPQTYGPNSTGAAVVTVVVVGARVVGSTAEVVATVVVGARVVGSTAEVVATVVVGATVVEGAAVVVVVVEVVEVGATVVAPNKLK